MRVEALAISEVKLITPAKHGDDRGFFSETYSRAAFAAAGIDLDFVQDNHSLSGERGVLRGLHYQTPPFAQAKLVRVLRGRIFDVAVDIRRGSPTYGRWVGAELSAQSWTQIFVPVGFAHGFCTLEPATEVAYKVSAPYAPASDRSLRWDDPAIGVDWPIGAGEASLSGKDAAAPGLADLDTPFEYA